MAKEASVAPKERVNISYRPAAGDAKEEVELPLKILVMGDFTSRKDDTPLEDRQAINVDRANFDEVLRGQRLSHKATLADKLSDKGGSLDVQLRFQKLADFEPDAIVQQVPELKRLLELREALKALKGPLGNVPEFRRKVQELVKDGHVQADVMKELGLE